eukprot:6473912-Amphidinium_carterae.1
MISSSDGTEGSRRACLSKRILRPNEVEVNMSPARLTHFRMALLLDSLRASNQGIEMTFALVPLSTFSTSHGKRGWQQLVYYRTQGHPQPRVRNPRRPQRILRWAQPGAPWEMSRAVPHTPAITAKERKKGRRTEAPGPKPTRAQHR